MSALNRALPETVPKLVLPFNLSKLTGVLSMLKLLELLPVAAPEDVVLGGITTAVVVKTLQLSMSKIVVCGGVVTFCCWSL